MTSGPLVAMIWEGMFLSISCRSDNLRVWLGVNAIDKMRRFFVDDSFLKLKSIAQHVRSISLIGHTNPAKAIPGSVAFNSEPDRLVFARSYF
jgi:hypothetical protein